jgi:prepilin-type N-terminal cleavage/methylation domain-containing protein
MPRSSYPSKTTQAGFSMLELVIVIIIISVLLAVGIDKLMKLQVQAERASMENTIGTLQSAIALTISEHIAKDNIPQLKQYIGTNPMALLANQPLNYTGSFSQRPNFQESASWWFNTSNRTLYYQVSNQQYFLTDGQEKGVTKFKILAVYDDNNRNGRFDRRDIITGLRLAPVADYRWLNEPVDPESFQKTAFLGQ